MLARHGRVFISDANGWQWLALVCIMKVGAGVRGEGGGGSDAAIFMEQATSATER
jgi:hypothetical protein